jgi:lipoprotein-anchoring transpeptidase ErfK/SrfK
VSIRDGLSDRLLISPGGQHLHTERVRHGLAASPRLKRILLGNVGTLALGFALATSGTPAAAQYFGSPYYSAPRYHYARHQSYRHKAVRRQAEETSKLPFGNLPKGPLEIFISIQQQRLHFYADGVHVADAPVATGVPGHLTPLGVFSVIERDRYHHSNIYSGAPMPYMERITWSGVALHEGPGVGHQASHGCIRMPQDFAARLWRLPTMGMRVIIARQELKPLDFADPHLFVHKDAPATSSLPPAVQTAQKVDPGTQSDVTDPAAGAATSAPQPAVQAAPVQGGAASGSATSVGGTPAQAGQADGAAPGSGSVPPLAEIVKGAAGDATAPTETAQPAPTTLGGSAANTGTTPTTPAAPPATTPTQPAAGSKASASTPQPASAPAGSSVAATPSAPSQASPPAQSAPPAPPAAASAGAAPAVSVAPSSLEQVPLPLSKPEKIAQGGNAPIAIFVSRKEGKIYVRQNFMPVFEAPVKIDHPEEPLGTYVFTAMDYMPDHSTFRWTVVTMPYAPPEKTTEKYRYVRDYYGRLRRVRMVEHVADTDATDSPPETPQQALARIHIPQEALDQISRLMVPGSSLIVSDQGLGRETGRGTDFIVVQRW